MEASEQIKPVRDYNRLAILSFILGLMTIIFPIIAIFYLVTVHGGPGYVQSLFCGIPVTFLSTITGITALVETRRKNQKGVWMATSGIVFGILFFVVFYILVAILLGPYLLGVG
jgi:hypothetical protein